MKTLHDQMVEKCKHYPIRWWRNVNITQSDGGEMINITQSDGGEM